MEEDRVEVLSRQSNAAVVRMPGRAFPGVVLQGGLAADPRLVLEAFRIGLTPLERLKVKCGSRNG
ncbi:hypothetical protein ASNO1_44250 [Corallococcus caeni]|uniref:Uncharacterized protein n=2 Tax=Corallococcus caeni TaxID=3082388 RepID=A0ABQ6QVX0_9BACT|nr:hypothetical protein ASNO1_44250 [Corallococcus sp. NO1]